MQFFKIFTSLTLKELVLARTKFGEIGERTRNPPNLDLAKIKNIVHSQKLVLAKIQYLTYLFFFVLETKLSNTICKKHDGTVWNEHRAKETDKSYIPNQCLVHSSQDQNHIHDSVLVVVLLDVLPYSKAINAHENLEFVKICNSASNATANLL